MNSKNPKETTGHSGTGPVLSLIKKRSLVIGGHRTSVSLEDEFWQTLKRIAANENLNLSQLVAMVDVGRTNNNLSSALRLFVLDHIKKQTETCGMDCQVRNLRQP